MTLAILRMRVIYSLPWLHFLIHCFVALPADGFENESEDLAQTADGTSGAKPLEKLEVTHKFLKSFSVD